MTRESLKKHKKSSKIKMFFPSKFFLLFLLFLQCEAQVVEKSSFFSYSNQFLFRIFFGG
jgi:hypothetical protein